MKQTVRLHTFETNSSSTHTCVISTDEERNAWIKGELYYDIDSGEFITLEELIRDYEDINEDDHSPFYGKGVDTFRKECAECYTFDEFDDKCEYLEHELTHRVINGTNVNVDCWSGYDC